MTRKRIAIVLYNLGGPDCPEAIQPFLFNLFSDSAIIRLPNPLRWLIAKLISKRRAPEAQEIYHHLGGRSPILPNTEKQAQALQQNLENSDHDYRVFIAMRYWHPLVPEVVQKVRSYDPEEVVLVPLYPQFSTTTTGSFVKCWEAEVRHQGWQVPTKSICCYPTEADFIAAHVSLIQTVTDPLNPSRYRLLFSAHGLPERIIQAGDSYQWQVEQTAAAVVAQLNLPGLDWQICYQSRVGPLKWIGPSTEAELERAIQDQKDVVLVPIAFVSDHSETLVELDIQYRQHVIDSGRNFYRVPTLGVSGAYIDALKALIIKAHDDPRPVQGSGCPEKFGDCPCRIS
jgi:ferrochelatase